MGNEAPMLVVAYSSDNRPVRKRPLSTHNGHGTNAVSSEWPLFQPGKTGRSFPLALLLNAE